MIHIKDLMSRLDIFKALSSEIRIQILEILAKEQALNLNDLASRLQLSNGAVTMHIKKLEESGLIEINTTVGKHGIQKLCYVNEDQLVIDLQKKETDNLYEVELFREIQFSMELGSEAPGYCDNYPSDIYFYVYGVEIGCWTSPGDFGDSRGSCNPDWWPPYEPIRPAQADPGQPGGQLHRRLPHIRRDDRQDRVDYKSELTLRIAVTEKSVNKRGLTIYGKHFGNYSQDLLVRVLYDVREE